MFIAMRRALAGAYDGLLEIAKKDSAERIVAAIAAAGFLGHLLLVGVIRIFPGIQQTLFQGLDRSFLHAVYTPFSIILFYEVLLLVFSLAESHTVEVAKQYQVVSLIVVRRVFKDIGNFESFERWFAETEAVRAVLVDMGGAVLMFILVTVFVWLHRIVPKVPIHRDLNGFIEFKKASATVLLVVLSVLAMVNMGVWLGLVPGTVLGFPELLKNADVFFFPYFFEFMIFTDVFILILSLAYYDRYEHVFRNAGFIISTILLRLSLSAEKPFDIGVGLIAMAYGTAVLAVFGWYSSVVNAKGPANQVTA
ncbi:hypothetical protein EBZ80_19035 [bacterium]|nr:hypothetical protein [bacterium]